MRSGGAAPPPGMPPDAMIVATTAVGTLAQRLIAAWPGLGVVRLNHLVDERLPLARDRSVEDDTHEHGILEITAEPLTKAPYKYVAKREMRAYVDVLDSPNPRPSRKAIWLAWPGQRSVLWSKSRTRPSRSDVSVERPPAVQKASSVPKGSSN
jgi:hypothetical protein